MDLLLSPAFSKYSLPSHIYKQHPTSRKIQLLFSKVVKKEQYYLGELRVSDKNDRNELLLYIAITDEATSEDLCWICEGKTECLAIGTNP